MHPHEQSNKAISRHVILSIWDFLLCYFPCFASYILYLSRENFVFSKLIIINKLSIYFVFYFYFFPIFLVIPRIPVLALLRVFFRVLFVSSLPKITFPHSISTRIKDPDENWAKPVVAIVNFFPFIPRIPIPVSDSGIQYFPIYRVSAIL